jgi:beta-phosphoglucomutase
LNVKAALIFDMDGVIVDSNPFHKIALKQFCKKYGKDVTEDELREKIYGRRNQEWLLHVFGQLDPEKVNAYADEKEALFRDLYQNDIKLVDGLAFFLKKVHDYGFPRAIATSAPRSNVDFTLAKTHTGHYFETILDSSFVDKGKPHPQIYLKTVAALHFDPRNCIVFEDSLAGVESARNAGCKVVGITTTHTAQELEGTDLVIENFVGLDPKVLISKLFGT